MSEGAVGSAPSLPTVRSSARLALAAGLASLFGRDGPLALGLWDGSEVGPATAPARAVIRHPRAVHRLLWAPGELGLARAYVVGEIELEGDLFRLLMLRDRVLGPPRHLRRRALPGIVLLGLGGLVLAGLAGPPPVPPEEARLSGRRHSRRRDAAAISHHYDDDEAFYRIFLGETMAYSCAYFPSPDTTLDEAQRAKWDLICTKLGLRPGDRLLDVGCGWGGLACHAASHYGARVVGVSVSAPQIAHARATAAAAGVERAVEFRLQDYRDVRDGPFDAISSVGMFEHVGLAQRRVYLRTLHRLLRPEGRLLNHAISRPAGVPAALPRRSFVGRYVFPDGELAEVGSVVSAAQAAGFEVRDVESLREHYGRTLRTWVANLEAGFEEACRRAGETRARIWRLYMAGAALAFEAGRLSVHQVLAVRPGPDGRSGMPATRAELLGFDSGPAAGERSEAGERSGAGDRSAAGDRAHPRTTGRRDGLHTSPAVGA